MQDLEGVVVRRERERGGGREVGMNERFLVFCFLFLLWYPHHPPSRSIAMGSLEWWLDVVFRLHTHALRAEQKNKEKSCGFRGCVRRATCSVAKPRNGACFCSSAHRGTIRLGTIFALSPCHKYPFFFNVAARTATCGSLRRSFPSRALISLCNANLTKSTFDFPNSPPPIQIC